MQDRNYFNEEIQNLHEFRLKSFTFCREEKYHYKINTWVIFGIEFLLLFTFSHISFGLSLISSILTLFCLNQSLRSISLSSVKTRSNWKLYISCTRFFVIPKVSFARATMYCETLKYCVFYLNSLISFLSSLICCFEISKLLPHKVNVKQVFLLLIKCSLYYFFIEVLLIFPERGFVRHLLEWIENDVIIIFQIGQGKNWIPETSWFLRFWH